MSKSLKYVLIICLIVLVAGAWYFIDKENKRQDSLVKEVDVRMPIADYYKYEKVITDTEKDIAPERTLPGRYDAYVERGNAYHKLGKLEESRKSYEEAIKLIPDNTDAHLGMHEVQIDMTDTVGAEQSIQRLLEINSSSPYWLKYIDFKKNNLMASQDEIKGIYVEAVEKTDNHVRMIISYAEYLEEIGDNDGAKAQWQKAKEVDPEDAAEYDAEIQRIDGAQPAQP